MCSISQLPAHPSRQQRALAVDLGLLQACTPLRGHLARLSAFAIMCCAKALALSKRRTEQSRAAPAGRGRPLQHTSHWSPRSNLAALPSNRARQGMLLLASITAIVAPGWAEAFRQARGIRAAAAHLQDDEDLRKQVVHVPPLRLGSAALEQGQAGNALGQCTRCLADLLFPQAH